MKIAYIIPGTGGAFYCENCIRDCAFISGLTALGHQVTTLPMYLQPNNEGGTQSISPIFFGAIRLYLQVHITWLRKIPYSILRFLDHPYLLKLAANLAGSTRASGHEELTLSVLRGHNGPHAQEFVRLVTWITKKVKPDLIIISNAFLLGIATTVKAYCRTPVICLLQDEHIWVDSCAHEYQSIIWHTIAKQSRYSDLFLTHSHWFADKTKLLTGISSHVIPFGIDVSRYTKSAIPNSDLLIGYLGRMSMDLGMGILSEAFTKLVKHRFSSPLGLAFCGGFTHDDQSFVKKSLKEVSHKGKVIVQSDFGLASRVAFLAPLTLLSVPARQYMSCAPFIVEALACGVPVVQPDQGGFSEIVKATGGGLLYSPNNPDTLGGTLESLLKDKKKRMKLSKNGHQAVLKKYNNTIMVQTALKHIA